MTTVEILDAVSRADAAAFHFLNGTLYWKPLADLTFFLANDRLILGVLLAAALSYYYFSGWRRTLAVGFWSAAAVFCSSLLHNEVLKPFFERTRPFLALADVHLSANLRDLATVTFSFPSTHSSSAAALAMVASGLDPRLRVAVWIFALGIGFGAMYSGGHYPLDVASGYAVGLVLGAILRALARKTWPGRADSRE